MHAQITVIGPIASGKTTAAHLLRDYFGWPLLDADLFEDNPFLPLYAQDIARWSFATELFFTIQRLKKLKKLPRLLKKSSVVVDSGLIMSHQVYTKNHLVQGTMTAAEWDFFCRIIADYQATVPAPDLVISLSAPVSLQLARIADRGRSFEAGYTPEYLSQITDRLAEYVQSVAEHQKTQLLQFSTEMWDLATEKGKKELIAQVSHLIGGSNTQKA